MIERRHFRRILYRAPAMLQQASGEWRVEVLDLSLKGLLMTCPHDWQYNSQDNQYVIAFCLHESDIELRLEARLVSHDANYLHMHIHHIDIESASHLRRLVELNVGTDALLHRELEQLADLHHDEER